MAAPIRADVSSDLSPVGQRSVARQFFSVRSHEPVWRALRSSIARGDGVIVVTGEEGIGKSQLLLRLQSVLPENRDIALVADPSQSLAEFTHILSEAVGAHFAGPDEWSITPGELLMAITHRLNNGRKLLVAIDQAERISPENLAILDQLVLYSVNRARPVQILLVGRPVLFQRMDMPEFQRLQSTLIASVQMTPLTRVEVWEYIRFQTHRILGKTIRMTWPAWLEIFAASRGNPQAIDVLLQKVLYSFNERGARFLTGELVRKTRMALDANYHPPPGKRLMPWLVVLPFVVMVGYLLSLLFSTSISKHQERLTQEAEQAGVRTGVQSRGGIKSIPAPDLPPKVNVNSQPISSPLIAVEPQKVLEKPSVLPNSPRSEIVPSPVPEVPRLVPMPRSESPGKAQMWPTVTPLKRVPKQKRSTKNAFVQPLKAAILPASKTLNHMPEAKLQKVR